ncbi:hypothetical protein RFI_06052, partial [Reticulomyxa filosa]
MAQAPTTTENNATTRFDEIKKMGFVSQTNFFVNVWWSNLVKNDEHKNAIVLVLGKFHEQNIKFGAPPNCISSVQFCHILQQLEKNNELIGIAFQNGDRTKIGKRFVSCGIAKLYEVTLLEAYIFLFTLNVNELMTKPSTPCEEAVRKAKTDLAALEARQKEILGKKEALEAKIEKNKSEHNLSPIQVAQTQQ